RQNAVSTQLAVLAAAPVVAAKSGMFAVERFLARQAQAHARHGPAPGLGNRIATFLAMRRGRSLAHLAARTLDRVLDGGINLVVDGVVAGPAGGHVVLRSPESGVDGQQPAPVPEWGQPVPIQRPAYPRC